MFEKNMRLAYLLDFYGDVLDEHSKNIMRSYYEDDLSLAEIAEGIGISRQGVRHIIKKSEEQLDFLEQKLKLADKFLSIEKELEALTEIAAGLSAFDNEEIKAQADKISASVEKIKRKNN